MNRLILHGRMTADPRTGRYTGVGVFTVVEVK